MEIPRIRKYEPCQEALIAHLQNIGIKWLPFEW